MAKVKRGKVVRYNKWGYIFLIPFVAVYVLFQLIPLFRTFYYSFFENYRSGLTQIGPTMIPDLVVVPLSAICRSTSRLVS